MGQGTGLGLATVYAIIKNHGGIIKVQSRPGEGTAFHLYLPVTHKPVAAERSSGYRFIKGTGTILLVDDEDGIRSVGKRILERLGYEILLAEERPRGPGNLSSPPGLHRPGDSGYDHARHGGQRNLLEDQRDRPPGEVLLVSGYSLDGEAQEIMAQGAQGFIQKPYRIDALSQKIAEVLRQDMEKVF